MPYPQQRWPNWSTSGLTDTEKAYKNRLMESYNASPGLSQSVKDAMFGNLTKTLDQDVRAQIAAADRDMIRRGFGINSGESLNRMQAINRNRANALADASRQVEMYADQVARQEENELMNRLFGFGSYERGNEQAALDREYNDWLRQQASIDNAIAQAMGFAGLNSGMATTGYQGYQDALAGQSQAYGNLGAWGMSQLQNVDWNKLFGFPQAGGYGSQPNDDLYAGMGSW